MSFTVYPRGFSSRHTEGDQVVVSKGDESIELLYATHMDRGTNVQAWTYRRSIVLHALRLFGDLEEWFQVQLSNPNVVGYNRAFLLDTSHYLHTGKRELSVSTWFDLVQEGGAAHSAHAVPLSLQDRKIKQANVSTDQLLQKWLSMPNGFEDLLSTLHLLFGNARQS